MKGIAPCFERSRWQRCNIYYKPAVGTTYGGLVAYGADWNFSMEKDKVTRLIATSLTPNSTHAVWADTQPRPLRLPANLLNSRKFYNHNGAKGIDAGPARIVWSATGTSGTKETTLGEIWCDYKVTLSGTQTAVS